MKTSWIAILALALLTAGCGAGGHETLSSPAASGNEEKALGLTHRAADAGLTESDFPISFYPGSKPDEGAFDLTSTHDIAGGRRIISSSRVTTDSVQQVANYYKGKMKVDAANASDSFASVTGVAGPQNNTVQVMVKKEDRGTTITVTADVAVK